MTDINDIEIALQSLGLKEDESSKKQSNNDKSLCRRYSAEDKYIKLKVTVQVFPKVTLLELLAKNNNGGY